MWVKGRSKADERRGAPRVAATGGVLVTWEAGGKSHQVEGKCADLSAGGTRIRELPDSILVSTQVHLRFMAIDLEADGIVTHSAESGSIGVKFERLTFCGSPLRPVPVSPYARAAGTVAGVSLSVLVLIVTWHYFTTGRVWPGAGFEGPATYTPMTAPSFTLGSSKAEVQAVQGTPSRMDEGSWIFGSSRVYFKGDRVVGWQGSPGSPLNLRVDAAKTAVPKKDSIEIGSTASEVADVQGVPPEVRGDVWIYGPSEVYLRDGRVVGWKSSPQWPLKVKGAPRGVLRGR